MQSGNHLYVTNNSRHFLQSMFRNNNRFNMYKMYHLTQFTVCLSYRWFSFGHCVLYDLKQQVLNVYHFENDEDMFLSCIAAVNIYKNFFAMDFIKKTHTDRLNINKFKILILGTCSYCILRLSLPNVQSYKACQFRKILQFSLYYSNVLEFRYFLWLPFSTSLFTMMFQVQPGWWWMEAESDGVERKRRMRPQVNERGGCRGVLQYTIIVQQHK